MRKRLLICALFLFSIANYAQYWEPQTSGVGTNLNDVYCITEDIVVIVGSTGTILKTTDGGAHWLPRKSGTTNDLEKVQFINSNVGYAVGWGGTILKSVDGGENWTSIALETTANLTGLSVLNENTFYISGENGLIKRTNDGGTSFIDKSYVTTDPVKSIQFINDQLGYASSYNEYGYSDGNNFVKTTDGGTTWTNLPIEYASSFYFLNEDIGFIKVSDSMNKTIDGGLNLSYVGYSGQITADIFSLNENVVWNVEDNFMLCGCSYFCIKKNDLNLATDLQQTANCHNDNIGPPFSAIHFANETTGFAVGWLGMILKNSTGIMENLASNEFVKKDFVKMYPNPASNQITLSFTEKQAAPFSIEITDFLGKKIMTKYYDNQDDTTINIASFSNGIYIAKVTTDRGKSIRKIIKE